MTTQPKNATETKDTAKKAGDAHPKQSDMPGKDAQSGGQRATRMGGQQPDSAQATGTTQGSRPSPSKSQDADSESRGTQGGQSGAGLAVGSTKPGMNASTNEDRSHKPGGKIDSEGSDIDGSQAAETNVPTSKEDQAW